MKTIIHIAEAPGGVERYLYMLLKKMDRNEYNNILVVSKRFNVKAFKGISAKVIQIPMQHEINPGKDIRAIMYIRRIIRENKPDVVYCHSSKAGALGRIARIGFGCKCIYNAHGWAFEMRNSPLKRVMYLGIERILAPLSDRIVTISEHEKRIAIEKKVCKESKITRINNGIDIEDQMKAMDRVPPDDFCPPKDAYVIGMIGRITRQKSPEIFVQMAMLLKQRIPESYFVIVGDGDERKEIEELIKRNGLQESFYITGWIDQAAAYLKHFQQAVLLSRWEGFGLVLLEYMLAGLPIVATNVDAIPDICTKEVGKLVPVESAGAAADAVYELYLDPQRRQKLGCNGIRIAQEKYNIGRVVDQTQKLIDELLKR